MRTSRHFFELLGVEYGGAALTVRVAELLEGETDGYIGKPLLVKPTSQTFTIHFIGVTEFRSRAEPCYTLESTRQEMTPFLYECLGSDYIRQVCPFGRGAKEPARHFVVYTESVVIEALASTEPTLEPLNVA